VRQSANVKDSCSDFASRARVGSSKISRCAYVASTPGLAPIFLPFPADKVHAPSNLRPKNLSSSRKCPDITPSARLFCAAAPLGKVFHALRFSDSDCSRRVMSLAHKSWKIHSGFFQQISTCLHEGPAANRMSRRRSYSACAGFTMVVVPCRFSRLAPSAPPRLK